MSGWRMDSPEGIKRMEIDAAFLEDEECWPGSICSVKTQPWVENRQFGYVEAGVPFAIRDYASHALIATYETAQDMVKVWSVD